MERGPSQYCDLVMKGGITSGVIYPAAAFQLAQQYSFKNIGGTSAGAIAAAVVAAAELGRRSGEGAGSGGNVSFDVVKALSSEVAKDGKLLKLFTPDRRTAKIFRVALSVLGKRSMAGKIVTGLVGLLFSALFLTILTFSFGLALPIVLFALAKSHSLGACIPLAVRHPFICFFAGAPIGLAFALIASVASGVSKTIDSLASNSFGICSGMARASKGEASLTEWIHKQIQAAAGRAPDGKPVTFGDLWDAPAYDGELLETEKRINLVVVTTSLTEGRPYSIPFRDDALYFDSDELRGLFPPEIVNALSEAAERAAKNYVALPLEQRSKKTYRPVSSPSDDKKILTRLPDSEDLPILVATRMSLSFPGLLSAIPFYRVDYTVGRNQDQNTGKHPTRVGTKVWFSDGGICSNFPINLFDSPIPRWPTFGINLTSATSKSCAPTSERPAENFVTMLAPAGPARIPMNDLGDAVWTTNGVVEQKKAFNCVALFAHAIFNTMQNWRDNLQAIAPGFRDRIASVQLCSDEGGLNLNMPDSLIEALTERGQICGEKLNSFDFSQHAFTRFRISLCAIEEYLVSMDRVFRKPLPQDEKGWEYIKAEAKPPHYDWPDGGSLAKSAAQAVNQIHDLLALWEGGDVRERTRFCVGVPRPKSALQAKPDF